MTVTAAAGGTDVDERARESAVTPHVVPRIGTLASCSCATAIAMSLLTSAAQSLLLVVRHFAFGQLIGFPREFVWWNLLAYVPFFLALWILCLGIGRLIPPFARLHLHGATYAAFGALSIGVLVPTVSHVSQSVLAIGIGMAVGGALAELMSLARRWRPVWVSLVAFTGLQVVAGYGVWRTLEQERRALPPMSVPAAASGSPNVVVLILDTVRAISLSAYGNARPTSPRLDALAAEGARFASAFSTAPWTLPSHASLFTSRLPHQLSFDYTAPIAPVPTVLARVFHDHGWATGAAVGNMYYTGWETGVGRGFEVYRDYLWTPKQVLLHAQILQTEWARRMVRAASAGSLGEFLRGLVAFQWYNTERFPQFHRKWADDVNHEALDWIASVDDRPVFAFLNYFDAHAPYTPPTPDRLIFDSTGRRRPVDLYEGAIRFLDTKVGEFVDGLARMGKLDNTILVITSDHGEQFGEHGLWEHGNSTYAPVLQVPLIIRMPGGGPGRVFEGAVSLADLPRTLTELAGLPSDGFDGVSLAPLLRGARERRGGSVVAEHAFDRRKADEHSWRWRALMDDSLAYVESGKWKPELFRLSDRKQAENLADRPGAAALMREYRARLDRLSPARPPVD